jgi:hypothetical protein
MLAPDQVLIHFLEDLEHISRFNKFLDRWIEEENCRYEQHLISEADILRYDYSRDLSALLNEIYPQISRQALVLYIYSALEDNLNQFCESLKIKFQLEKDLLSTKGTGLERVKSYLTKSTPLEFSAKSELWQKLTELRNRRDILAHASGYLDPTNEKHKLVASLSEKETSTSVSRFARDRLTIEQTYVEVVVSDIKKFHKYLIEIYNQANI